MIPKTPWLGKSLGLAAARGWKGSQGRWVPGHTPFLMLHPGKHHRLLLRRHLWPRCARPLNHQKKKKKEEGQAKSNPKCQQLCQTMGELLSNSRRLSTLTVGHVPAAQPGMVGAGKEAARSLSFPRKGEGNKTQEDGSGKGKTHLLWMVLLQLGSQQPLAEDTPGSSQQLLTWDKNPSRYSAGRKLRIDALGWPCLFVYLLPAWALAAQ